jgi:hypothetical protein
MAGLSGHSFPSSLMIPDTISTGSAWIRTGTILPVRQLTTVTSGRWQRCSLSLSTLLILPGQSGLPEDELPELRRVMTTSGLPFFADG